MLQLMDLLSLKRTVITQDIYELLTTKENRIMLESVIVYSDI